MSKRGTNEVSNVKYVDAHYGYGSDFADIDTLPIQEAYGYIEKSGGDITVVFIKSPKKFFGWPRSVFRRRGIIIKGLVIPQTNLVSCVQVDDLYESISIPVNAPITVLWHNVLHIANLPRRNSSLMRTEGILAGVAKDHIVVTNPSTTWEVPKQVGQHPEKPPSFYRIPIVAIKRIQRR